MVAHCLGAVGGHRCKDQGGEVKENERAQRTAEIADLCRRLASLLDGPEPGLGAWNQATARLMAELRPALEEVDERGPAREIRWQNACDPGSTFSYGWVTPVPGSSLLRVDEADGCITWVNMDGVKGDLRERVIEEDEQEGGLRPVLAHLKARWRWEHGSGRTVIGLHSCITALEAAVAECGMRLPPEETESIIEAHREEWEAGQ